MKPADCDAPSGEFGGLGNNRSIQLSYGTDSVSQRKTAEIIDPRHTPATPEAVDAPATTARADIAKLNGCGPWDPFALAVDLHDQAEAFR